MVGVFSTGNKGNDFDEDQHISDICMIQKSTDFIKINERQSRIYVCHENSVSRTQELHSVPFEKARQEIMLGQHSYIDSLGTVKRLVLSGQYLLTYSKQMDGTMSARVYDKTEKFGSFPNKKIGTPNEFHLFERDGRIIFIDKHSETELHLRELEFSKEKEGNFKDGGYQFVDTIYSIKEIYDVMFKFPYVLVIKGGSEIIHMNVSTKHFDYLQLPGCIAAIKSHSTDDLNFTTMIDIGGCYVVIDFVISDNNEFSLIMRGVPIFKDSLPFDQLLGMLEDPIIPDEKAEKNAVDQSFILHFKNTIFTYSLKKSMVLLLNRSPSEIKLLPHHGFMHYKKNEKDICLIPFPLDNRSQDREIVLYSSNNFLKRVVVTEENDQVCFYIVDEAKYLSRGIIVEDENNKFMKITDKYFVSKHFDGTEEFTIIGDMVVTKSEMIRVQDRGTENDALDTCTKFRGGKLSKLPITSEGALLTYFDYEDANDPVMSNRSAILVGPSLMTPVLPIMRSPALNEDMPIKYEFFYYSEDLFEEFIVSIRQGEDAINIAFYHLNGVQLCSERFPIKDADKMTGYDIVLSTNGKYLLVYKWFSEVEDSKDDSESILSPRKAREDQKEEDEKLSENKWERVLANIYEIVLVRAKSKHDYLRKIVTENQQNIMKIPKLRNYIKKYIISEVKVGLKKIREIKDLESRCDRFNMIHLTGIATIVSFQGFGKRGEAKVYYEDQDLSGRIHRKVSKRVVGEVKSLKEYKWLPIKAGFILFDNSQAYFVNMNVSSEKVEIDMTEDEVLEYYIKHKSKGNEENKEPETAQANMLHQQLVSTKANMKSVVKIDFQVGTTDLAIQNAYECKEKSKVVFCLSNHRDEHLFIVWDLQRNAEDRNFSTSGKFKFIVGESSKTGYIVQKNCYTNLDHCLPNHFIECDFANNEQELEGYSFNRTEEIIVLNQNVILKTTFAHVSKLDSHLNENITFEEDKFDLEDLKFIVDNNTVFHLYARNEDALGPIVAYLIEKEPKYLCGIMIKNNSYKTPLEIAYDSKNPNTIRILLMALAELGQDHCSKRFYEKFPEMIMKGMKSFQAYLETCTFQTIQMKNMQYLAMQDERDVVLTCHSSCILSEDFLEDHLKITKEDKKLKKDQEELERRKDQYEIKRKQKKAREKAKKRRLRMKKLKEKRNALKDAVASGYAADPEIRKHFDDEYVNADMIGLEEKDGSDDESETPEDDYSQSPSRRHSSEGSDYDPLDDDEFSEHSSYYSDEDVSGDEEDDDEESDNEGGSDDEEEKRPAGGFSRLGRVTENASPGAPETADLLRDTNNLAKSTNKGISKNLDVKGHSDLPEEEKGGYGIPELPGTDLPKNVVNKVQDLSVLSEIDNVVDKTAKNIEKTTRKVVDETGKVVDKTVRIVTDKIPGKQPTQPQPAAAGNKLPLNRNKSTLQTEKEELDRDINDFYVEMRKKYEKNKSKLNKYDVKAIEFSWLFRLKPRTNFLSALADTPDLEIFSLEIIENILMFLWGYYKKVIFFLIFIPFLIYFVAFILWASWINEKKEETDKDDYDRANLALIVIIYVGIAMNAILELNKIYYSLHRYFFSNWNRLNFTSLVLNCFIVTADLADLNRKAFIPILAIAVLLMWLRLFSFGRIFLSTAWMVRMIKAIIFQIKFFLFVLAVMVIGFANVFYIVARIEDSGFAGDNFWRAIIYSWLNTLGTFELDDYLDDYWQVFLHIIWIISTLLIFLVMLNMLIAIISDIFEKVLEKSHGNLLKEITQLMLDTNWIFRFFPFFTNTKYIITFTREQGEKEEGDEHSRLAQMKKSMNKIIVKEDLENTYNEVIDYMNKKIEQRGVTLETSANSHFAAIRSTFDKFEEQMALYREVFKEMDTYLYKRGNFF